MLTGTYTKDDDKQKVDISDVVELKPQVLRDEAQWCVFCGSNLVSRKLMDLVTVLIDLFRRQRLVRVYRARFRLDVNSFLTHRTF